MVQRQVFLKGRGMAILLFIFSRFIIFTFRNYFTLSKIVFEEKFSLSLSSPFHNFFFCSHNFMKKGHSKLSKNEPENIPWIKITYL